MTLRVLHLASGNMYGGVERILVTLARMGTITPEVEYHFGHCFHGRLEDELRNAGTATHFLGNVRFSRPWTVWKARRNLARLLASQKFDVVVCHSAWPHAIFNGVVRKSNLPIIFWLHNRTDAKHWTERLAKRRPPNLVLAVSKSTAETASVQFPTAPTEVFYSPIPMKALFAEPVDRVAVREELNTQPDSVVIIQASRMEAWKGHLIHIQALDKIKNIPNWTCWIAGGAQLDAEKHYLSEVKQLVEQKGLSDRVLFLGDRSDVPRLLLASDLFCQPNLGSEGFSIAFMEAYCAKLPIITGRIGGGTEIVDATCGRLVTPGSVDETANALRELIANAGLRKQLGEVGFNRVGEMCDPSQQMKKLARILAEVVLQTDP